MPASAKIHLRFWLFDDRDHIRVRLNRGHKGVNIELTELGRECGLLFG